MQGKGPRQRQEQPLGDDRGKKLNSPLELSEGTQSFGHLDFQAKRKHTLF